FLAEADAVLARTAGIRRWGSAALDFAYVAAGRYEGFWERGLSSWDSAAGMVLVREAGGSVTRIDGRTASHDSGDFLASNTTLHQELVGLLRGAQGSAG
ncbi:MAG TPA: inositol monophosphatase family protein, partial [Kiloniellales bacterium]|nr:inositol monophosphatase family protein [Kiloniellales bacterium]